MSADANPKPRSGFIIIWEFRARPEKRHEFEDAYGPEGIWAQFFRRGEGYVRTELHSDPRLAGRYLTLDFWESPAAFEKFKCDHAADYRAIDDQCESLTTEEKLLADCDDPRQLRKLLLKHGIDLGEELRIRPAIWSDIPPMLALEQASPSAAHWDASSYACIFDRGAPPRIALLVEGNHRLQGFVIARLAGADCELENIVVDQSSQCLGCGQRLIAALTGWARERSAARIFLEVRESNIAARGFYEKCKFTISGRRAAYYKNPAEDAVTYVLQL